MDAVGGVFTTTVALVVVVHEFAPVTVTVYVPAADTLTAAFVPKLFDHAYVPPPLAVNVVLCPEHIVKFPDIDAVGNAFATTVALAVVVHEFAPVTVTVYVPAADTLTAAFAPKLFDHAYVPPPLAVKVVLCPEHMVKVPDIDAVGGVFTTTVALAVVVHEFAPVTVTV
jgi:hypothetical protein